ncbi:MAG: triose-phosphate isomerase [Atopobiaceae bacterium]|nr:triose-phosphate isomerase [Atopobiaceae bacterium]
MDKVELRRPFFVINPKSYLYGEQIRMLAKKADELCGRYGLQSLFTAQLIDLPWVIENCPHLIPCAQFMESLKPGRGMGHVLPEALAEAGVKATFLNHAENPMTVHELAATISRANELGILTCVCADSVEEARAIAELHPDIITCELTSLIGTGKVAGEDYMRASTDAVKEISPHTMVLQAAGIHNGSNVYDAIMYGADATGGTSGIVSPKGAETTLQDMFDVLDEMFAALDRARTEIEKGE